MEDLFVFEPVNHVKAASLSIAELLETVALITAGSPGVPTPSASHHGGAPEVYLDSVAGFVYTRSSDGFIVSTNVTEHEYLSALNSPDNTPMMVG